MIVLMENILCDMASIHRSEDDFPAKCFFMRGLMNQWIGGGLPQFDREKGTMGLFKNYLWIL